MISTHSLGFAKPVLCLMIALHAIWPIPNAVAAATAISDQPIFVTNNVPPNMMLALSVEWPTGMVAAYKNNAISYSGTTFDAGYVDATRYVGYFDPTFCYKYYKSNGATVDNTPATPLTGARTVAAAAGEYFRPVALGTGTTHQCDGTAFSGNFLNWATAHALDGFRFSMTGGDRVIAFDTATMTVLEKSRHTGQGGYAQFPIKNGTAVLGTVAPFGTGSTGDWDELYVRVHDNGSELNPWSEANSVTRGRVMQVSNNSSFDNGGSDHTYTFLVRVQVCDSTHATASLRFEYNSSIADFNSCLGYPVGSTTPTVYKPVGLIQKNSTKMRFGATGYLLDSAQSRAGGVLRARMKSVGPNLVVANGPAIPNSSLTSGLTTFAEWDAATGVYVGNPDPTDATASGVANSGVINYLNKFGKLTTSQLKSNDPFGELYYSALRSLRNMTVPDYVSGVTAAMRESFPVITTTIVEPSTSFTPTSLAPLPIQYFCQQNNIVGIADTNCHTDVYVPGNTLVGYGGHPTTGLTDTDPVNAANNIDVVTLGNAIGALEFSPAKALGTIYQGGGGRKNTFHLASLAYWANTKDMLPDDAAKPWTKDKQQAKSYFVDVRENGSDGMINNQMWLAAKYGGFDDRNSNGIPATLDTWHTNTDVPAGPVTNQPGATSFATTTINIPGARPDNYFTGDSPEKLFSSLSAIFNSALARSLSGAGASISTINFQGSSAGNGAFTVQYNAKDWTGDIKGNQITVDATGTPTVTNMWSAQAELDTQVSNSSANNGWHVNRKIVTYSGTSGIPFRWASLTAAQKLNLPTEFLVQYLRGRQCHEVGNSLTTGCSDDPAHQGLFRTRTHILGDIISSEATVVGAPSEPYTGLSGYLAFTTQYKSTTPRKRVLYVGANDGMMHAFDGDVGSPATTTPVAAAVAPGTTAGQELWAYVPNLVLAGPTLPTATHTVDGLAARSAPTSFSHKYYVDQTPFARDIDFYDTKGAIPDAFCTDPATTGCSWRTIVVGGLGKGGRGYYALDVTNPADWTDEAAVAGKVLWEFRDEDMGFSFGRPLIVRTARDGWVVILSSGYNNVFGSDSDHHGKGYLFIVNAKTGALIEKISTGVGSATDPSGFAHPAAFIPDSTTFLTDYVYGGDLNGNLWRFDLRNAPTTYPAPTKIAKLTTDGSDGATDSTVIQPITIEPKIEIGANGIDRWVFIGTGKLLTLTDMDSVQQQAFYAVRDGSRSQVYGTDTGQTSLPSTITFPVTRNSLVENSDLLTGRVADSTKPMGWYYELSASEKITTPLVANEGLISWNGYVPTTDACAPGAASNLYVTDYEAGKSRLYIAGVQTLYFSSSTYLIKLQFIKDSAGKIRAVVTRGDASGGSQIEKLEGQFGRAAGIPVRVNWREIQK